MGITTQSQDRGEELESASSIAMDPAISEAVANIAPFRHMNPEAYRLVVEGCDALVELWMRVVPGDDARAMHPRLAAQHVTLVRRGMKELTASVAEESGGLLVDFEEHDCAGF